MIAPDIEAEMEEVEAFLAGLFEFELCEECGLDADAHEVVLIPPGLFFAQCCEAYRKEHR